MQLNGSLYVHIHIYTPSTNISEVNSRTVIGTWIGLLRYKLRRYYMFFSLFGCDVSRRRIKNFLCPGTTIRTGGREVGDKLRSTGLLHCLPVFPLLNKIYVVRQRVDTKQIEFVKQFGLCFFSLKSEIDCD